MPVLLPDVPNAVKAIVSGTQGGLPWVNTFHLTHSAGSLSQATLDTLATNVMNTYVSQFLPLLNSNTSVTNAQVIDISARTGLFGSQPGSHPGTNVGTDFAANNVALVLSWNITDRYRGGHPRTYIPGQLGVNIVNGHTWQPGYVTLAVAAARGFRTALNANGAGGMTWQMVCVRYFSQHQLLDPALVRPITDARVHGRVDTMRRRLGKETP